MAGGGVSALKSLIKKGAPVDTGSFKGNTLKAWNKHNGNGIKQNKNGKLAYEKGGKAALADQKSPAFKKKKAN